MLQALKWCPLVETVDLRGCPQFKEKENRQKMARFVLKHARKLKNFLFESNHCTPQQVRECARACVYNSGYCYHCVRVRMEWQNVAFVAL